MDEDCFTLVKGGRQNKKRKAEGSAVLYSPPGASTAGPSNTPARPKPSSFKNTIPVILSDVDPKFNTKVKLMSELKQFHPYIKVSKVLERKDSNWLLIGDTHETGFPQNLAYPLWPTHFGPPYWPTYLTPVYRHDALTLAGHCFIVSKTRIVKSMILSTLI